MTDYSSQGRTCANNVVDLTHCKDHHSYYTCLSQGSTAHGTVLLQPFNKKKIIGGCSGFLRQEFRELEILDHITKLHYLDQLDNNIKGVDRNSLILSFLKYSKTVNISSNVHPAIRWQSEEILHSHLDIQLPSWQIIKKSQKSKTKKSPDSEQNVLKRKIELQSIENTSSKKFKLDTSIDMTSNKIQNYKTITNSKTYKMQMQTVILNSQPLGLRWNENDWSCAYDSLFFIIFNTFLLSNNHWKFSFHSINDKTYHISNLLYSFQNNGGITEIIRDNIRSILHYENPTWFPYGQIGTSVACVALALFNNQHIRNYLPTYSFPIVHEIIYSGYLNSIFNFINNSFLSYTSHIHSQDISFTNCNIYPPLIIISFTDINISIDKKFILNNSQLCKLVGIVYHGHNHFISRLMLRNDAVWCHDGIHNAGIPIHETNLTNMNINDLWTCRNKQASVVIYKLVS